MATVPGRHVDSIMVGFPDPHESRFAPPPMNHEMLSKHKAAPRALVMATSSNRKADVFGPIKAQPDFSGAMFLMGSLSTKNKSPSKRSPRGACDFGKREGHGSVTGRNSPKKTAAYPVPEFYDVRNAFDASSLSKRMPNLVNMDKEQARNSSSLYSKADVQYMREAAREQGK